ncbi:hypothetical protein LAZ67_17001791 [Cordylochernes scorpioides]|uniref:Histone-lysine N-methyltransferase SETMAR n=1 Tax=Cordylochernes scorpioides TaxID=51811 RepID=A0ABY6LEI3_9ARAC|nr:hypothetical protein LAZ67_17001791 [Cordylochernes scorpioides]
MLTKGVRFHHDNARPHTAHQTTALIEEFGCELVSHPPYSPDVAPSDLHLFPELNKNLGGTQFQDDDELEEAVLGFLRGQAAEFFDSGFHKGGVLEVLMPVAVVTLANATVATLLHPLVDDSVGGKAPGEEIEGKETTGIHRRSKTMDWTTRGDEEDGGGSMKRPCGPSSRGRANINGYLQTFTPGNRTTAVGDSHTSSRWEIGESAIYWRRL